MKLGKKWLIPVAVICLLLAGVVGSNYAPASLGEIFDPSGNPFANRFTDVSDLRAATFVVSANNSEHKFEADYRCDGTADQVQIQAAIDALPAVGGKVFLLEGTYNTTENISMNKAHMTLEGAGRMATIIQRATEGDGIVVSADGVTITNLWLYGKNSVGNGINLSSGMYEGVIKGVYIWYFAHGIHNNALHNISILDNRIKTCGAGIWMLDGHDIVIEGNQIEGCTSQAVVLTGTPYTQNYIGNIFEDGTYIATFRGKRMSWTGNLFNRGASTTGVAVWLNFVDDSIFADNIIGEQSGTIGLNIYAGVDNLITGNQITTTNTECDINVDHETDIYIADNYLPSANQSILFYNNYAGTTGVIAINNLVKSWPVVSSNTFSAKHLIHQPYHIYTDFFIPAIEGYISSASVNTTLGAFPVIQMPDGTTSGLRVTFAVPYDFVSFRYFLVVWSTPAAGTKHMRVDWEAHYAADSEAYNVHSDAPAPSNFDGGANANDIRIVNSRDGASYYLTFPDLAKGDYVGVQFARLGADGNDTLSDVANIIGFRFYYVAEGM